MGGGIGAVAEPLVVVSLLVVGTWINRDSRLEKKRRHRWCDSDRSLGWQNDLEGNVGLGSSARLLDGRTRSISPSLVDPQEQKWRKRTIGFGRFKRQVTTPNTRRFRTYLLSRVLERFPFLVECWYWALIYWVCLYRLSICHPFKLVLTSDIQCIGISIRSSCIRCIDRRPDR